MYSMSIDFIYDSSEDYSPYRDNFLTPVYFDKKVLIEFIYNSDYTCTFVSETYGTIYFNEGYISFGINPKDHLILWLGDLNELPDSIKHVLKSKNIQSDHNIESEFKEAQLYAKFTEPVLEVEVFSLLNKINQESKTKFNFNIFNISPTSLDGLFDICSKYKKIIFNDKDDFKRIISELNEKIIEVINRDGVTSYLVSKQKKVDSTLGNIKRLEIFLKEILLDNSNIIAPFFYLYDLRIWSDHFVDQKKFEEVIKRLGLQQNSNFNEIYKTLIKQLHNTLNWVLEKIKEIN